MTIQQSYTKVEKELLPKFRQEMNKAESTEDVKKFFSYNMQALLSRVFTENFSPAYGDVVLQCDQDPPFILAETVRQLDEYEHIWGNSDLPQIMSRFATMASNRHNHLQKNPEKTESKIRM